MNREQPQANREPVVIASVSLEDWERKALRDYHALIQTPRGATRFVNTYRLLRGGIQKGDDWKNFCGDGEHSGDFRLALLLLAAAAGCPAVVRDWFSALRERGLTELKAEDLPGREWSIFAGMYNETVKKLSPVLTNERLKDGLDMVERFTF